MMLTDVLLDNIVSCPPYRADLPGSVLQEHLNGSLGLTSFVRFPDHGFMKHLFIFMQFLCLNRVTCLACLYCSPQRVKGMDLIIEMKDNPGLQFYLPLKRTWFGDFLKLN